VLSKAGVLAGGLGTQRVTGQSHEPVNSQDSVSGCCTFKGRVNHHWPQVHCSPH